MILTFSDNGKLADLDALKKKAGVSSEEWDYLVELGVGDRRDEAVLKQIPTATKTAFTRK